MNKIRMELGENSYDILVGHDLLSHLGEYINLNRRVLIVTDDGVPAEYARKVASQCQNGIIETVKQGEDSKTIPVYAHLLEVMLQNNFNRKDAVIAVGGGVVGDLSGFVAASFMRGIDFYNCPTTVLSQVDSSIGGKTALNLGGVKNSIGAFFQPKEVFVDMDVLKSLPQRQIANGLAEAVKMAATFDASLFQMFETDDPMEHMQEIIEKSLEAKKMVVEQDEKEAGLRKVLNFGHTIGHGIETGEKQQGLYHGECVALGMLPMCSSEVHDRLVTVLKKLGLPTSITMDKDKVMEAISHDKKSGKGGITVVTVDAVGSFNMTEMSLECIKDKLEVL